MILPLGCEITQALAAAEAAAVTAVEEWRVREAGLEERVDK